MNKVGAKNKVPAIRFEGFSGAWEDRILETIFKKIRNAFVGTASPYYVESGNFYLESNNVKNGKINRKNEIFINDEFYKKQSDKWLRTGDIVMVQSGHVGHTAVIPPELNNIAAHALIMFTEPKVKTSPYFLNYQFQTIKAKNRLSEITTGNTIKHILSSEMKVFDVSFPHHKEQTKIGEYFQQLDSLIAQHQQKHDKLLNLKKSLLEKVFPKQGATEPAIRFKGFSGAWEEKALEYIVEKAVDNRGKTPPISSNGEYPLLEVASLGSFKPNYLAVIKYVNKNTYNSWFREHIQEGDILFSTVGNTGLVSLMDDFKGATIAQNIVAFRCINNNSPDFIYSMFQVEENLNKAKRIEMGAVQPSVKVSQLIKIKYMISQNIEEQTKIGNLFKNLDTLITQHQAQLNKLNTIKQACLAKMFV